MRIKTIGLPAIHKEKREVRAFLPGFLELLSRHDVDIYLEKGYGGKMGFSEADYLRANHRVRFVSNASSYSQDLVIVLRAPNEPELAQMRREAGLLAMLHYDSQPALRELCKKRGIRCFSLDAVVDDNGNRMVVSYEQTAWAGVLTAFQEMEKRRPDFLDNSRSPYRIIILGMGHLGVSAGRACFKYSLEHFASGNNAAGRVLPGITVTYLERDITHLEAEVAALFRETDLLIDATKRSDYGRYIIGNHLVGELKQEALILDLTADHYDETSEPAQVKAIEGLPYGTLDHYVIETDDPAYERIPSRVNTTHRRVVVSCNGWPGLFPEHSMQIYGEQIFPLINVLLHKGFMLNPDSPDPRERALVRATIDYFEHGRAGR